MDVALYVGLTVACIMIGGLGFFLARLVQRKGRDHSLYSMARSGKSRRRGVLYYYIEFTRVSMFAPRTRVRCMMYEVCPRAGGTKNGAKL